MCFTIGGAQRRQKGEQPGLNTSSPTLAQHKHIICVSLLISLFAAELVPHLQGKFPPLPSFMLSLDLSLIKCMKTKVYFSTWFIMLATKSVFPPNWKFFQYCILLQKHFKYFGFSHPCLQRSPVSSVFENVITYETHKFTDMRHLDIY